MKCGQKWVLLGEVNLEDVVHLWGSVTEGQESENLLRPQSASWGSLGKSILCESALGERPLEKSTLGESALGSVPNATMKGVQLPPVPHSVD